MERGRLDADRHRPLDGALEDVGVLAVHAEDEAGVDHHAEIVEPDDGLRIVPTEVLGLAVLGQVGVADRFEADEDRAKPGFGRSFDEIALQDRVDRRRALPQAPHSRHRPEELPGELSLTEDVIVEEVEVLAGE